MLLPSEDKRTRKVFNITQIQEVLDSMKEYMLFIHAFTGYDTTSSLHCHLGNDYKSSSPQEFADAGEAFMCPIHGGKPSKNINKLRYLLYLRNIAKQKIDGTFRMPVLPPKSEATKQHSFSVFHRVPEWKNWAMEPTVWGWKFKNGQYSPIPTLL
ncbi:hypothetical protein PR048_011951 [Dryococelus australis]|uniref:Uncharacterized protein n=1 Tax=Dryococelus australis TaxID=614101 RepID=A0ABQ9HMZ2_9NEOP|nr:hypothetical protein PR048_011951 [Dryococelus australis]